MDKILLIDGNSILNRAFYGTQSSYLKNAEGFSTGALYGFMNMFLKQLEDIQPQYAAVAFDVKAPTFRHKSYPEYKAGRHATPPELLEQFPVVKEIMEAMGIAKLELEGYEADDLLGTYSRIATENNIKCYIMTGDRDSLQLVNDNVNVLLCSTQKGKPHTDVFDIKAVEAKYGVPPSKLIDMKALMGDSSDNIPGVPGVGEKTAATLLTEYDNLDDIYENVEKIKKVSLKEKLIKNKELAYLSQMLGRIDLFVPYEADIKGMTVDKINESALKEILERLEFKGIKKKLTEMGLIQEKIKFENTDGMISIFSLEENFQEEDSVLEEISASEFSALIQNNIYIFVKDNIDGYIHFDACCGETEKIYRCKGEIQPEIKEIFENDKIGKIFFDAKPFVSYLTKKGINLKNIKHDLSVASYILDSTRKSDNIEDVCRFLTSKQMPINVKVLMPMAKAAEEKIKNVSMEYLYNEIELPLIQVLADMEIEGFKVDADVLRQQGEEIDAKIESVKKDIFALSGHDFNINSPKQLGVVLFEELKLKSGKKTKNGYSTGQEVLENLVDEHPIVPLIMEYRLNSKLKSTYIDGLINVIDVKTKKVHSCFNQKVTATGRLSSTEPNLQNIPIRTELGRLIRKAFVPSNENHILIDADYSQIELRVLAHYSKDKAMCEAFNNDADIHTITAAQVNGVPVHMVTPIMRSNAKAVNFGIVYGISDFGLAKDLGIPVYEAKKYISSYFNNYPGIDILLKKMIEDAKEKGYSETLTGRRRYLPEINSPKYMIRKFGERVAMNMPIQGTAADIIKIAMINVNKELKNGGYKSKLILQVHDELLIDAPIDEAVQVKELLENCMQDAFELLVPLKVDVNEGKNWYDCK